MTCQPAQVQAAHRPCVPPVCALAGAGSKWPSIIDPAVNAFGVICLAMVPIEMRSTLLTWRSGLWPDLRLLRRH